MLSRLKPAVPIHWLFALAGVMWSAVGLVLCRMAYTWLAALQGNKALLLGLIGSVVGLAVYRFGFSRIAVKNIARLSMYSEKVCIFAFQAWKSYLIIAVMITLGIILRHSVLPKHYLAVVYTAIGVGLFLSGLHYYVRLWQVVKGGKPGLPSHNTIEENASDRW